MCFALRFLFLLISLFKFLIQFEDSYPISTVGPLAVSAHQKIFVAGILLRLVNRSKEV